MIRENETKKEYLDKFRENRDAVKRIEEQIKVKIHGSSVTKDLSAYIVKKNELVEKMLQARYRRLSTYSEIFQAIEEVPDERERQVLTLRYIKGLKWEEIAVEMHVEWAQVHRIHARALGHFKIPT